MSIRSNWCEFDKETVKYIKKRDKERCVICGFDGALQIMHIFLNRSHGGKGSKENGACGCVKCHRILDNPIGTKENELSKQYNKFVRDYLIEKESITYNKEFLASLKYKKDTKTLSPLAFADISKYIIKEKRCENCRFIVKNKFNHSSIPTYFCKARKQITSKKGQICSQFKEGSDTNV